MSSPFRCKVLFRKGPAHRCFEDRSSKEEGENQHRSGQQVQFSDDGGFGLW